MRLILISILLLVCAACTVEEAREPGPNGSANATTENAETSSNGISNGDSNLESASVTVAAIPVEWGLFAEPIDPSAATSAVPVEDGAATLTLPAGVFEFVVEIDGEPFALASSRPMNGLAGQFSLAESEGAHFFSPDEAEVSVEVDKDSVTLTRIEPEPPPSSPASVEPARSVGHAFDRFLADYDPSGEERSAVFTLLEEIRLTGGTPIQTLAGDLFVAPSLPGDTPHVQGSFNGWNRESRAELRQLVPGISARYLEPSAGRQAYKITYGDSWTTDLANPHVEWDGIDPGTTGEFNSVIRPDDDAGRLFWWPRVHSPELDNYRDIYIYLPPDYGEASHPLLIAHDGNESIVRGRFHEVLDAWTASRPANEQPVVAFVALPSQDVRISEYSFGTGPSRGDAYGSFLAETLLPRLQGELEVTTVREAIGLIGASLGGLISYYVLTQETEAFGYAAGMSSSFFWEGDAMLQIIDQQGCLDAHFYLDSGSPDDNFQVTQRMRDLLDSKGCRYRYVLDEGGTHEWWKWNERLPGVLDHFAEINR